MINMPGGPEIAVILVIALIVLGPQQLPKAMRTLGNAMAEIRKISNGFQAEMRSAMDTIETQGGERSSSGSTPSGGAGAGPTSAPVDTGVTEVVARNPAPVEPSGPPASSGPTDAPTDATTDAPPAPAEEAAPRVDPADRAAG